MNRTDFNLLKYRITVFDIIIWSLWLLVSVFHINNLKSLAKDTVGWQLVLTVL